MYVNKCNVSLIEEKLVKYMRIEEKSKSSEVENRMPYGMEDERFLENKDKSKSVLSIRA